MKKNTTDAKRLIQQAITSMPEDFALSEARFHLKAALGYVENVEQKRQRREMNQKQNEINTRFQNMGNITGGTIDLRENLKVIDELIAAEKKKLDEIAAKKKSQQFSDSYEDDVLNG